ncbi:uncharacterized protein LOC142225034 [Haematobia irritans]|uniref:uncharacterized protein LOC142225034 n=1 Tax=Haematobia irritans TaxID=7368 RepID=UPI003F505C2F
MLQAREINSQLSTSNCQKHALILLVYRDTTGHLLIYKLHEIGLSSKIVRFLEQIYASTKSAVWTGTEYSEYFATVTGVKQGCLLSPILFALYLNDLHDQLEAGLFIDNINIRLLMYADDIVILAEDPSTLQQMINNLQTYCLKWGMEVNQAKSEIMVFRKGGRLANNEKWSFMGESIRVVNEYKYLGLILTPKMTFKKHLDKKNVAAKLSINSTWSNFIVKSSVPLKAKWKLFLSVCRSIHSYGAEIWGNSYFEEVEKLYRYFIKRILKLPENTPNYIISLETGYEPGYIYTYNRHLSYLGKLLFDLDDRRLPHTLASKLLELNISWFKDFRRQLLNHNISTNNVTSNKVNWLYACQEILNKITAHSYNANLQKAQESETRFYRHLDLNVGVMYCNENFTLDQITYIMKARGDLFWLNGNTHVTSQDQRCSLCNLGEIETINHIIGRCPVLNVIRLRYFNQSILSHNDIIHCLNGGEDFCCCDIH